MNAGLLASIESHPLATAMVIVVLFLIREIFKIWRGKTDATTTERKSLKLAEQTSETVNSCKAENRVVLSAIEKHMDENDIGHISSQLTHAIQLLEKVDAVQGVHTVSLDRLDGLCGSIIDDLRRGDHRVVHTGIISQIGEVKRITEDTKQLAIHIAEKI